MTTGAKKRRKLLLRWEQQKTLCHWCNKETVLIMRSPGTKDCPKRLDEATIDHLRSRYHPDRQELNPNHEIRQVMACWKCNNERNTLEEAAVPIEELHRRSGQLDK